MNLDAENLPTPEPGFSGFPRSIMKSGLTWGTEWWCGAVRCVSRPHKRPEICSGKWRNCSGLLRTYEARCGEGSRDLKAREGADISTTRPVDSLTVIITTITIQSTVFVYTESKAERSVIENKDIESCLHSQSHVVYTHESSSSPIVRTYFQGVLS